MAIELNFLRNLKLKQWAWFCGLWIAGLFSVSVVAYAIKALIHAMQ